MLEKFAQHVIRLRAWILLALGLGTAIMSWFAGHIAVRTEFSDLLPYNHPYVAVDKQFRKSFGSSNMVSIMVEVENGDIFSVEVLDAVKRITRGLERVDSVNPFQINSLAAKKVKEVRATNEGIDSRPLMWPNVPQTAAELDALKRAVVNNPLVYGRFVSHDLKAALITVDFYDSAINFSSVFGGINSLIDAERRPGLTFSVVGEPILYGWISSFLPETFAIFLATLVLVASILFLSSRSLRGTILPMLAGLVSAVWALGTARLLGYSFDPLVIVVAFLISARSVSHSVQVVSHFDYEARVNGANSREAARSSISELFKPGTLGVVVDAGGMLVVALTPIPLLEKVALIGCVWVLTISLTSVLLTPVLLSYVRDPRSHLLPFDISRPLNKVLDFCSALAVSRSRRWIVWTAASLFLISFAYSFKLTIGDASQGSPILHAESVYNQAATAINARFHGSDRMFIVASTEGTEAIKKPEVLAAMEDLQRFMEAQPEIGATVSAADVVPAMNRIVHEGNPRYQILPSDAAVAGELLYFFAAGTDASDTDQFVDPRFRNASITAFFTDRKGETIATAIGRIKHYLAEHKVPGLEFKLAGGIVGVTAAINEIILADQIQAIALALLVVVIGCLVAYRDAVAGIFFMVPVVMSNTITFGFMALTDIGMNINTLPVAALGIGLGVDYSFYIIDRIKEELPRTGGLAPAIREALRSSGRAVLVTGLTLCASVLVWTASSLKFQAEMGLLMGVWLFVSAIGALVVMPAMVVIFRPAFVVGRADGAEAGKPQGRLAA